MEQLVSQAILETFFKKMRDALNIDAAIVGGGPSGLVCAETLARSGRKVALFEKKLAPGGGMWGGAMLFNQIVVQQEAIHILDEYGISYELYQDGYYTADSVEATAALIYHAKKAGVTIFNGVAIEDVVFLNEKVSGLVINWTPVSHLGMHVDPMVIMAKTVLDGTGHPCEIANILAQKNGVKLGTETGAVMGERSLAVGEGEKATVENTREIFPGLFVSGMAANGVHGAFRMGPIFGGMLLSGKKAAKIMRKSIEKQS